MLSREAACCWDALACSSNASSSQGSTLQCSHCNEPVCAQKAPAMRQSLVTCLLMVRWLTTAALAVQPFCMQVHHF